LSEDKDDKSKAAKAESVKPEAVAVIEPEIEVSKEAVKEGIPEVPEAAVIAPGKASIVAAPIAEIRHELMSWVPKTTLGKEVLARKVTDIDEVLKEGRKVMEWQIVDMLVPDLKNELLHIGGRKGKGGGKQRIPVKITATMHRSGRRFTYNALAVVGNENGLIGLGRGSSIETRAAIAKAINKAKMNLIRIKRGCGSWECRCGGEHSIPYKVEGKAGSVRIVIMPAPKGLGIAGDDETKLVLHMAGVKDAWVKTYGNTSMRINLVNAVLDALKQLYMFDRS
jgi:small subunit ribosomal protein S5